VLSSARVMAANDYLSNLTISTGSLSPGFLNTTLSYTASESSSTASITVTPTASIAGSTITVNGTGVASGSASGALALSAGSNTITIIVSKAGNTTETYTITVTRQNISYTGSPFTYYAGTAITALNPTATGAPTGYSSSPTLPTGLSITAAGVISGTATVTSAATTYTITATYAGGITATTTINITVLAQSISYTGSPFTYYAGTAIASLTPTVTNSPTGYTISPALPTGLTINAGSGVISGTATVTAAAANYTITATYGGGVTATTIINITVIAQTISYTGSPFTYYAGTAITSLIPTVTNSPTGYAVSPALPAGLSISATTGVISGTATVTAAAANYTVTATYGGGVTATTIINITVIAQTISYTGSPFSYYATATIASLTPTATNSPTGYTISPALPAGLTINAASGVISGAATVISAATTYTITATYGGGVTATTTINITILTPTISYTGSPFTYLSFAAITPLTPTVTGTPTGYSVSPALPAGLSISPTTGVISGTPTTVTAAAAYTITATYGGGITANTSITITVNLGPPVISYTPSTNIYTTGVAIGSLTPVNTGGAAASYSISPALPAGLSIDPVLGVISGTPTAISLITTYTITATNSGGTGTTTVTLTVNPPAPVISYTPSSNIYTIGVAITSLTPANTGGAATSYSIDIALPTGMLFNTTTGVISGTPTVISTITTYTITATNAGGTGNTTETITVNPVAPAISYTPSTNIYTVGTTITPLTPANTGGASTDFIIGPSLPAGLSFDNTTGIISGTPTAVSSVTTYTITGTNDGGVSTATITLSCVLPTPPVISYSPSTNVYTVGVTITSLTPTNTGGIPSSYSISTALPAGLSFSTTTGVISGTPTVVSSATVYTITATNTAGSGNTTVTITVNPVAPAISYSPSTNVYTVGTAITPLTPVSTGGPVVSYAISPALSAGLSFSTTTGVISGTPTATSASKTYTITATNAAGNGTTTVTLTVNNLGPAISYSPGTVTYIVGTPITPATPTSTGTLNQGQDRFRRNCNKLHNPC